MDALSFQSGHIQKMLGIPKQRVEYLALKIPIKPEIEEADGTGRAHSYSFKNALQFAIAQSMSRVGLGIWEIRSVLLELDSDTLSEFLCNLFDPHSPESGYVVITKMVDTVDRIPSISFFQSAPKLDLKAFVNIDVVIVINLGTIKAKVLKYVRED